MPTLILRPRGLISLQSFFLQDPRKLHGLLPPLSTFVVFRSVGSSVLKGIPPQSSKGNILSYAFSPPRRLYLKPAAFLLPSYVIRKPVSKDSLLLKLLGLSAFPDIKALLFTPL